MPLVTITSSRFPGAAFPGCPWFASGQTYEISEEQAATIIAAYAGFDPMIKSDLRVEVAGAGAAIEADSAIALAVEKPATPVEIEDSPIEAVPDIAELSDDDLDLIQIELGKLDGKTIAQAEPLIIKTGGNPELPRLLRVTYLKEVIAHPNIKKGLKDVAEKLLEQI